MPRAPWDEVRARSQQKVRFEMRTKGGGFLRTIFQVIGRICMPLKPLLEWAGCELRFGELMGFAVFMAALLGWLRGWRGFSAIVVAYLIALVITTLLESAIAAAEEDSDK